MPHVDIVSDPRYAVRALSDAIMRIPNEYSLLSLLGLFPEKGIRTTYVEIEYKNGTLNLIPTSARGSPAPTKQRNTRGLKVMKTQFMQLNDTLRPSDLQNLPEFGTTDFFQSFDSLLAERFFEFQRYYRQTHEYWRWGALQGDVLDADGTTVLYNCYDEMGEQQHDFDFKLGTTTSDGPLAATKSIRRFNEKNLLGEPMTHTLVLCSATFFDGVTQHPALQKFYEFQSANPNPLVEDVGVTGFYHGGVLYIEHNGVASYLQPDGTGVTHQFIPDGEAISVPMGTQQAFRSYFAPGEMMSTVNMPGQSMYVSMKELDHQSGYELHTESAPLFVVQKPRLVGRCYSSN